MFIRRNANPTQPHCCSTPDTILQSRYQIVRHLGKGGMGAVYEAIDLRLGHTVALKQTLTSDPQMWKQFEREARLMAGLNHFALPRVTDYFTEGNRAFLVMQFVEGTDLAEMIAQQPGPFPRNAVVAWADQLLDALIYLHAHERQIIHRDIKPHNLKVTPDGHIVLLDFGLAKSQSNNSVGRDHLHQRVWLHARVTRRSNRFRTWAPVPEAISMRLERRFIICSPASSHPMH